MHRVATLVLEYESSKSSNDKFDPFNARAPVLADLDLRPCSFENRFKKLHTTRVRVYLSLCPLPYIAGGLPGPYAFRGGPHPRRRRRRRGRWVGHGRAGTLPRVRTAEAIAFHDI